MARALIALILLSILALGSAAPGAASSCTLCHETVTPAAVSDWQLSRHAESGIDCAACHGLEHQSASDVEKAMIPTPATCGACHEERVRQFQAGKHAAAWAAMEAMPTIHYQPMVMTEGMKGCGGCHKIGAKTAAEIQGLVGEGQHAFGVASCDACHTRHTFSVVEARQPQACRTCHMGFDHPQWEMYSASKHGVRALLKQSGTIPEAAAGPTCQTCHMPDGDHGVMTAWGFLAVRLPMPEDRQWAADRATILQGLGVLDPAGAPTARLDVVKAASVARLTEEEWQAQRDRMLGVCGDCHAESFARGELAKGDEMIRHCDHLMAEGIREVAGLYRDGLIPKPAGAAAAFPDLLTFHDAATPIEQRLFLMFLEHRMRAFQGTFHANPDYALWYGWSEMVQDLTEIHAQAAEIREQASR
jgi:hypothetical protein